MRLNLPYRITEFIVVIAAGAAVAAAVFKIRLYLLCIICIGLSFPIGLSYYQNEQLSLHNVAMETSITFRVRLYIPNAYESDGRSGLLKW